MEYRKRNYRSTLLHQKMEGKIRHINSKIKDILNACLYQINVI